MGRCSSVSFHCECHLIFFGTITELMGSYMQIDTAISLLSFALTINASILTLAGAVYYYNESPPSEGADLFGAFDLSKSYISHGKYFPLVFNTS